MPVYTIETPRGRKVKIEADDEATAVAGAKRWDLEDHAIGVAEKHGVSPDLVLRQVQKESRWDSGAISPKGARGIMQLMPDTAKDLGVDPDDDYQNIEGGVRYLKQMRDQFGSDELALAAYNAGPGAVQKYGGVPPFKETQDYVASLTRQGEAPPAATAPTGKPSPKTAALLVAGRAPTGAPAKPPARSDEGFGFWKGLTAPLDNAASALQHGVEAVIGEENTRAIERTMGALPFVADGSADAVNAERQRLFAEEEAKGRKPGKVGEFAGNMVGTLLAARATGLTGPLSSGALSGALLSEGDDAGDVARDALLGAGFSKLGDAAGKRLGSIVTGVTDDAVQKLAKSGVPMTLGQMTGGMVKRAEDAATSIPFVGDVIKGAQRRSMAGLNAAAVNRALTPVGAKLPPNLIGREAFDYADTLLGDKYDELLPTLAIKQDRPFQAGMRNLRGLTRNLPGEHAKLYDDILKTEVASRFAKNGGMSGEAMKDAESALSKEIRAIRKNPMSSRWDHKLADALQQAQAELRELVMRGNPGKAGELKAINTGWANLKRIEDATSSLGANEGVFTPAQLLAAVKRNAPKRQFAKGQALMQDLADAGKSVLPSSVPDSGTATRSMLGLLGAGGFGALKFPAVAPLLAGAGGGLALYSKPGQQLLTSAMTKRPALAQPVGKALKALSPASANAAVVAWLNSRKQPVPKGKNKPVR